MANALAEVIDKLLAQGLLALREMAITPFLVNRQYEDTPGTQGSTVDVPIPSALTVRDVVPGPVPPAPEDSTPTSVPIALSRWKEVAFHLTDKDRSEIMDGVTNMQASEAIRKIVNDVDTFVLGLANQFFGVAGVAGTTPFADEKTTDASSSRTVLNRQLAPKDPRHAILDPDAEGNALNVRAFQDLSYNGSTQAIIEGNLNRKLGFNWWMDQNIQSHVAGTATGYLVNGAHTIGTKTIVVDTGTGDYVAGDIITFANHTQTYVLTAAVGGPATSITIEPGLQVAVPDNTAIADPIADHVMNVVFHRDAIALVSKPMAETDHPASIISQAIDEISGLVLRLEVSRQHRQDQFAFDVLYGANVIRRELGMRLLG